MFILAVIWLGISLTVATSAHKQRRYERMGAALVSCGMALMLAIFVIARAYGVV